MAEKPAPSDLWLCCSAEQGEQGDRDVRFNRAESLSKRWWMAETVLNWLPWSFAMKACQLGESHSSLVNLASPNPGTAAVQKPTNVTACLLLGRRNIQVLVSKKEEAKCNKDWKLVDSFRKTTMWLYELWKHTLYTGGLYASAFLSNLLFWIKLYQMWFFLCFHTLSFN